MRTRTLLLATATTIAMATGGQAATITIEFEGEVSSLRDAAIIGLETMPAISVGDAVTGSIMFDDQTSPTSVSTDRAVYAGAVTGMSLTMGSLSWSGTTGDVDILDGFADRDGLIISARDVSGPAVGGLPADRFQFGIWDLGLDFWGDLGLPTAEELQTLADSSDFDFDINFLVSERPLGSTFSTDTASYRFDLTSVTVSSDDTGPSPVPLPASAFLLGGALIGAAAMRRPRG